MAEWIGDSHRISAYEQSSKGAMARKSWRCLNKLSRCYLIIEGSWALQSSKSADRVLVGGRKRATKRACISNPCKRHQLAFARKQPPPKIHTARANATVIPASVTCPAEDLPCGYYEIPVSDNHTS